MKSTHSLAPAPETEYRVTLLDGRMPTRTEWERAGIGSGLLHLILIAFLLSMPTGEPPREQPRPERVTPLVDPPTRLTQKAPNKGPLSQEISVESVTPAPQAARRAKQVRIAAPPPAQVRTRTPKPALPQDPPKMLAQSQPGVQSMPQIAITPPPRTVEQPKLVLEAPPPPPQSGQGTGRLKAPGSGIDEIVHELSRSGGGSRVVGDDTNETTPNHSLNPTPSPTRPKSSIEMLSDPKGVDFRPYLVQVLGTVRRNWFTVMPESVRLGQRGRVVLQFSVAKDGTITKVVYSTESGSAALDRAAVAALSMSNRLPQLPEGYTADRVVLQFTFLYNAPR